MTVPQFLSLDDDSFDDIRGTPWETSDELFWHEHPEYQGAYKERAQFGLSWVPLLASTASQPRTFTVDKDADFVVMRMYGSLTGNTNQTYPDFPITLSLTDLSRAHSFTNVRGSSTAGTTGLEYSVVANRATPLGFDVSWPDFAYPLVLCASTKFQGIATNANATAFNFQIVLDGFRVWP